MFFFWLRWSPFCVCPSSSGPRHWDSQEVSVQQEASCCSCCWRKPVSSLKYVLENYMCIWNNIYEYRGVTVLSLQIFCVYAETPKWSWRTSRGPSASWNKSPLCLLWEWNWLTMNWPRCTWTARSLRWTPDLTWSKCDNVLFTVGLLLTLCFLSVQVDFRDYPPLLRQAVSIARKIQDPLVEYAQVCSSDEDILCLKLHPLQVRDRRKDKGMCSKCIYFCLFFTDFCWRLICYHVWWTETWFWTCILHIFVKRMTLFPQEQVVKEDLLSALYCEFINRVNEVGVDVNRAIAHPHTQSLVQFVCGLGPRKGSHLLKVSIYSSNIKFILSYFRV